LNGSLDPPPDAGDVDFYRFEGVPDSGIQIDLEGQETGKGTLFDPFLGIFDSACNLIQANDGNGSLNSRIVATVPPDGVVIVAATSCCDYGFQGSFGVSGSYQLAMSPVEFANSIRGQVVDAVTGEPLPGFVFPFAFVQLLRCTNGICQEYVATRGTEFAGQFLFERHGPNQVLLLAGTYLLRASASTYLDFEVGPFVIAEGEDLVLGDVPLTPQPTAEGVTGRIVDAVSGSPLPGISPPFASVELWRCDDFGCFQLMSRGGTDAQGRFRFERDFGGLPFLPGAYQLRVTAQRYEPGETARFELEADELEDLGDVPLMPFPIWFTQVSPCGDLRSDGGLCQFSVRIQNRSNEPVDGAAWSLAQASGIGTLSDFTHFQIDTVRRMTIPPGKSRLQLFTFEVPATVRNGANICVEMFFGEDRRQPFFNTVGREHLFCIQKGLFGTLTVLSQEESQRLIRERKKPDRPRKRDRE
jgi:hypothetical protein